MGGGANLVVRDGNSGGGWVCGGLAYMMLTDVSLGLGRALRDGTVGISLLSREGTVMVGAEGLMGMAAMLWWRYQAKTVGEWGGWLS